MPLLGAIRVFCTACLWVSLGGFLLSYDSISLTIVSKVLDSDGSAVGNGTMLIVPL